MRRTTKRLVGLLVTCAAVGLTACSPEPLSPRVRLTASDVASLSLSPTASAGGRWLVTFATDIPADFGDRVAALGGAVTWAHATARVAAVEGVGDAAAAALAAGGGVAAVEPDGVIAPDDTMASRSIAAPEGVSLSGVDAGVASPTNPAAAVFYGLGWQWNMRAIHADQAWSAGRLGSADVTVAILDAGIDYQAVDLAGRVDLSRSVSFVPSDDAIAAAFFPGVHPSTDLNGHGTQVATQVASNAIAFAGVTSRTRLIAVKVIGANGSGLVSTILRGVLYAADQGASVANMSIGGYFSRAAFQRDVGAMNRVMQYAYMHGLLIVAAAGNDHVNADRSGNFMIGFCNLPHVVCVAATGPVTPDGSPFEPASYSNYGRSTITLAAPGGNFGPLSNWPWGPFAASLEWAMCSRTTVVLDAKGNPVATPFTSGNFVCGSIGTSLAAPHVTGLAALLLGEYGPIGPTRLRTLLTTRAVDLGLPGRDPYYGWGHIDVPRALGF